MDGGAVTIEEGEDPAFSGATGGSGRAASERARGGCCRGVEELADGLPSFKEVGGGRVRGAGGGPGEEGRRGWNLEVGPLQSLASGALSYLMFAGIGGVVGGYFSRKRG